MVNGKIDIDTSYAIWYKYRIDDNDIKTYKRKRMHTREIKCFFVWFNFLSNSFY